MLNKCNIRTSDYLSSVSKPFKGLLKMLKYPIKPSRILTFEDAIEVWTRHKSGEYQHRIAAALDVNPGRISEVIKGKRFAGSEAAAIR